MKRPTNLSFSLLILLFTNTMLYGQNTISVPFPNGFVGENSGNNSATSCYYLSGAQGVGWSTSSEHNSHEFEIERSEDGLQWNSIGYQTAQGFSNQITDYEFHDLRDCSQCQIYYRIKPLDLNGLFEYSPTLTSDCSEYGTFAKIAPNPAHEKVFLSVNLNRDDQINFTITDLTGTLVEYREISGQKGLNVFEIDVRQLQSSYYLTSIKTSSEAHTARLQIVH